MDMLFRDEGMATGAAFDARLAGELAMTHLLERLRGLD
jgi:hypothetical protein